MFIRSMVTDYWRGTDCDETALNASASEDVVVAIKALDAKCKTMVILQGDGEHHMTVGGGGDRFVVYATRDNDQFFNLIGDRNTTGDGLLFVGGQEGSYPRRQIVDLEQAVRAAVVFAESGGLDQGLDWEEQE